MFECGCVCVLSAMSLCVWVLPAAWCSAHFSRICPGNWKANEMNLNMHTMWMKGGRLCCCCCFRPKRFAWFIKSRQFPQQPVYALPLFLSLLLPRSIPIAYALWIRFGCATCLAFSLVCYHNWQSAWQIWQCETNLKIFAILKKSEEI